MPTTHKTYNLKNVHKPKLHYSPLEPLSRIEDPSNHHTGKATQVGSNYFYQLNMKVLINSLSIGQSNFSTSIILNTKI